MSAPDFTGDDEGDLASLRKVFPGWKIARASGRWWAARNLVREDLAGAIQAATPDGLYRVLEAKARGGR
ncbi:hypothetical protein [Actinomadura sp. NTSP31]|uniref:hypothetical protein n=1 Tax=Actinomadura sp. NTSP31 TaxID=1735447 RepID=UPI0035C067E9